MNETPRPSNVKPVELETARGEGFDASEDGTGRGTPLVPITYSIMPQNSGKDYKARPVDVAQPVMAAGPAGANQGGDYVVQPIGFNSREDCVSHEHLAGSLGSSSPQSQAVAFALRGREGGAMPEIEGAGDSAGTLRSADGGSSRDYVAFQSSQSGVRTDDVHATLDSNNGSRRSAVRRLTPVECARLQGFPDDYLTQVRIKGKPPADGPMYKALGNSMAVPCMAWIGRRIVAVEAMSDG